MTTKTQYENPQYRESNPKIDLFSASGYVGSTNWHRNCRNALAYYAAERPEMGVIEARIDRSRR